MALPGTSSLSIDCAFCYPAGFALEIALKLAGGITVLVGPSGSGKTTLLQLIAGLLTPLRGRIELADRAVFDSAARINVPPQRRSIGFVFQDYQLFPHLSIEQNLQYGRRRNPQCQLDYNHLVDVLELRPLLRRYPITLSGGERQRTALGRAILRGSNWLLLDEPLSALDPELKSNVAGYLQRIIAEFSIPALIVTHDLEYLRPIAQRVIQMKDLVGAAARTKMEPAPAL